MKSRSRTALQSQEERKLAKQSRPKKQRNEQQSVRGMCNMMQFVQHSATSTCIVEIEPRILHGICDIWKIEPFMLHGICRI
jgi:hypothetical protein